jgi:hypothetical protein
MPKREPTSERHPSDALVERMRQSVESAAGMTVEGMVRGILTSALACAKALDAGEEPPDIVSHALTAATLAFALYQSLDDFKRHKTGTGLELLPKLGKDPPS